MKHLDLFSGIGGFSLAIDRVWNDVEHTFCEIDPFCQEVLKKHWPYAKIYEDIRTLTTDPKHNGGIRTQEVGTDSGSQPESKTRQKLSINEPTGNNGLREKESGWDILTGGFPCQPFSQAGRRKGTADDRHLWPEMLRVIQEFHPRWVVGENVGGFLTWNNGLVFEQVHAELETAGYEVQSFIIPAVSVNAPHRRDRIWIVANTPSIGLRGDSSRKQSLLEAHGTRDGLVGKENTTNSERKGHEGQEYQEGQSTGHNRGTQQQGWDKNWLEVATRLCRVDDGIPRRLDRNPRLKALGNAIVPQVAEEIFKAIKSL